MDDREHYKTIQTYITNDELQNAKSYLELNQNLNSELLSDLLFFASKVGNAKFVQHLLEIGADPFIYQETEKYVGLTPVHIATMKNHLEVKAYSIPNLNSSKHRYLLQSEHYELIECIADENHNCATPINMAADLSSTEMLDFYLEAGADVNKKDSTGHFPLWKCTRKGSYENVKNILEKGGPEVNLQDNQGITALHTACSAGYLRMTQLLLKHKANPNLKDNNGDTALHHAAQVQVQRLIFKYNLNLTDAHSEIFYYLITQSDVDVMLKNNDGDTALDIIEIPAADLFDIIYLYKKYLVQNSIDSFQKLLTLPPTTSKNPEIKEIMNGVKKFLNFIDERNEKNGSAGCVLVSSTAIPFKRKFRHLFVNGRPPTDQKNDTKNSDSDKSSTCPFGFAEESGAEGMCSKEESENESATISVCPITGKTGPLPSAHSSVKKKEKVSVCPITGQSGPLPKEHSSIKVEKKEEKLGVCPITGQAGVIPQGHSTIATTSSPMIQQKKENEAICPITGQTGSHTMNPHNQQSTSVEISKKVEQVGVCPITGKSGFIPKEHVEVKQPVATTEKSTVYKPSEIPPTTCPFSPNYKPAEGDGDKLPECSQQ